MVTVYVDLVGPPFYHHLQIGVATCKSSSSGQAVWASALPQQLDEEGHQVVLVDRDAKMVERARTRLDAMAVVETGLHLRSIDAAGVRDADVLIACTGSDEVNIITCLLAREIGIPPTHRQAAVGRIAPRTW